MSGGGIAEQGSRDWLEYRRRRGNASEAAALLDTAPWFPRTPFELWLLKTGRAEIEQNAAMARGLMLEPAARAFIERELDEVFEPQVIERERISASLDGLSFDGLLALEIKCPLRGRDSAIWQQVAARRAPPEHYWWQVQQQLYCAGAQQCLFVVCDADDARVRDFVSCEVRPDPQAHAVLTRRWTEFFDYLDNDNPPAPTERDYTPRQDIEWQNAAARWRDARRHLESAKQREAQARCSLIALAEQTSSSGAGVKLTRYWQRGQIDWRRATEGINVEPFRKSGNWIYRLSEQEN